MFFSVRFCPAWCWKPCGCLSSACRLIPWLCCCRGCYSGQGGDEEKGAAGSPQADAVPTNDAPAEEVDAEDVPADALGEPSKESVVQDEEVKEEVPKDGRRRIIPDNCDFTRYPWLHASRCEGGAAHADPYAGSLDAGFGGAMGGSGGHTCDDLYRFVRDHYPSAPPADQLSTLFPDDVSSDEMRPIEEADVEDVNVEGASGGFQDILRDAFHMGAPVFWVSILRSLDSSLAKTSKI